MGVSKFLYIIIGYRWCLIWLSNLITYNLSHSNKCTAWAIAYSYSAQSFCPLRCWTAWRDINHKMTIYLATDSKTGLLYIKSRGLLTDWLARSSVSAESLVQLLTSTHINRHGAIKKGVQYFSRETGSCIFPKDLLHRGANYSRISSMGVYNYTKIYRIIPAKNGECQNCCVTLAFIW